MQENKEEVKQPTKSYSYIDLIKFESNERFSTLGKQVTSDKKTQPIFGFGTGDRKGQAKIYQNKEMARTDFWGKVSPGPQYDVRGTDAFTYDKDPQWKIGTEVRNTLNTGAKHDYYLRKDPDFQPDQADLVRKPKFPDVRIGLESRFPNEPKRHKGTPGPQYNPSLRHEIPSSEKFSFGFRREVKGFTPLILQTSTPGIVGPGTYIQKDVPKTSKIDNEPHWSIGTGPKLGALFPGYDKNQTYDDKSVSLGKQFNSKKKSLPFYSFGRSNRDNKTGTFKDMMATQPTKIRINHPKV